MSARNHPGRLFDRDFERRLTGAFHRRLRKSPADWERYVNRRWKAGFKALGAWLMIVLMVGGFFFSLAQDEGDGESGALRLVACWVAWVMALIWRWDWLDGADSQVWAERCPVTLKLLQAVALGQLGRRALFIGLFSAGSAFCYLIASLPLVEAAKTGAMAGLALVVSLMAPGLLRQAMRIGRRPDSGTDNAPTTEENPSWLGWLTRRLAVLFGPAILLATPNELGAREAVVTAIGWLPTDWPFRILFESQAGGGLVLDARLGWLLPLAATVPWSVRRIFRKTDFDDWAPPDALHPLIVDDDEDLNLNQPPAQPAELSEPDVREDLAILRKPSPRWDEAGWLERLVCRCCGDAERAGLELAYPESPGWTRRYARSGWIVAACLIVAGFGLRGSWPVVYFGALLTAQASVAFLILRALLCAVRVGNAAAWFGGGRLPGSISGQCDLGLKLALLRLLTAAPVVLGFYLGAGWLYPHGNPIAVGTPEQLLAAMLVTAVLPAFCLGEQIKEIVADGRWSVVVLILILATLALAPYLTGRLTEQFAGVSLFLFGAGAIGGLGWMWYLGLRWICRRH